MIHPEIRLGLVEKVPHDECIRRKIDFDIYFDQLHLGYGNNAIESWALRQPCVVEVENEKMRNIFIKYFGNKPWCGANEKTLFRTLDELICDEDYRRKMGEGY